MADLTLSGAHFLLDALVIQPQHTLESCLLELRKAWLDTVRQQAHHFDKWVVEVAPLRIELGGNGDGDLVALVCVRSLCQNSITNGQRRDSEVVRLLCWLWAVIVLVVIMLTVIMLVIFKPHNLRLFVSPDTTPLLWHGIRRVTRKECCSRHMVRRLDYCGSLWFGIWPSACSVGLGWLNREMILPTREGLSLRWA